jgi:exodeoxyribonuclease V alpha subunit
MARTSTTKSIPKASETLTGLIERIYYSSERFAAGQLRLANGDVAPFRAKFSCNEGQHVTFRGAWVTDPKYGRQFDAQSLVYEMDTTSAGLAHWLCSNPAFFGIGPVKSKLIADAFGDNFDQVIRTDPAQVMRVGKLTGEMVNILQREWIAGAEKNGLFTWLSQYELTPTQMNNLYDKYGMDARRILENDPYILCREIRGYGFARTDLIAQKMGTPKMHPGRLRACLNDLVYSITDDGHCWIEARELLRMAEGKLGVDTIEQREQVKAAARDMCAAGELMYETTENITRMAHPAIYRAEKFLLDTFREARAHPPADVPTGAQLEYLIDMLPDLQPTQDRALRMALASRICVISGEAGTGKSYLLNAIRRAFHLRGKTVLMCAPTGKAAKRIEQLCNRDAPVNDRDDHRIPAFTIHRALGYNPFEGKEKWEFNQDNPLDCDVLLVDECGMLDVLLAQHVFEAVDLEKTQVILFGDHQQLPPVGPGNLLRDLLNGDFVPTIILDQIMRQAGVLKENSIAVLRGSVPDTAPGEPGVPRPWYRLHTCETPELVLQSLLHIIEFELPKIGLADPHFWQVLVPQHGTAIGTQNLNLHLQRLIQRVKFGNELPEIIPDAKGRLPRAKLCPGDRVIQTRNNYRLGVMNGAQGYVVAIDVDVYPPKDEDHKGKPQRGIEVDWSDGGPAQILGIAGEDLADIQLAYALTVHKAQGSEYPCAIVICSRTHSFMLSRNLLYTAVTRARQTCVLIGDWLGMRRAVTTVNTQARRTWLGVWAEKREEVEG